MPVLESPVYTVLCTLLVNKTKFAHFSNLVLLYLNGIYTEKLDIMKQKNLADRVFAAEKINKKRRRNGKT